MTRASTTKGAIRSLTPGDIPAVVDLHARAFGRDPGMPDQTLSEYFNEVFFQSPWHNERYPSLLYETRGKVAAFVGALPRPMEFRGRPIEAVVLTQFMADPEFCPPLVPLKLLRTIFAGPQDLVITDGANPNTRKLWLGSGGTSVPLYDSHWKCVLRPAREFGRRAKRKGGITRAIGGLVGLGAPLLDRGIRNVGRFPSSAPEDVYAEELRVERVLEELPRLKRRFALTPVYDEASLGWLFGQVHSKKRHGPLCSVALSDRDETLLGWYQAYLGSTGTGETIQLYARRGQEDRVVAHLLHELLQRGMVVATGRYDPSFVQALARNRAGFLYGGAITLCQTRDVEILAAIRGGDAFFTRLEAEWWLRFSGG